MPLSKPAWMAQEASEPAQKKQLTEAGASIAATAKAGGRGGTNKPQALEELVVVLAKLVLTDEAELRSLIGAVYDTWLVPISAPIVEKALEENQAFNSEAQTQRELEKEAQKAGKPFDKAVGETVVAPCRDPNELHEYVRFCRVKRVKAKNQNHQEQATVQFLLDGTAEVASQAQGLLDTIK
ncbi:unnamed protein product [Prorocentrum cordatum]|uniref:Uncharacterized protein n=1 Tax=Prorocentrum cordatum TaxID=2364126 RepID=A0ABN9RK20_9DINO|nr:unnamed protein product [Polarella glacialis]